MAEESQSDTEAAPKPEPQRPSDPKLGLFRTQSELAKFYGVNRRTICDWIASGAPGKGPDGRYDAVLINFWLRDRADKVCTTCGRPLEAR